MTPKNIQKSFSVTGICSFNPNIFTDDESLSSYAIDRKNLRILSTPAVATLPETNAQETTSISAPLSIINSDSELSSINIMNREYQHILPRVVLH